MAGNRHPQTARWHTSRTIRKFRTVHWLRTCKYSLQIAELATQYRPDTVLRTYLDVCVQNRPNLARFCTFLISVLSTTDRTPFRVGLRYRFGRLYTTISGSHIRLWTE